MRDIIAHRGIIICNKGFTNGAKKLAAKRGIDLCRIHDAESKNWKLELKLPVIVEKINPIISPSGEVYLEAGVPIKLANVSFINDIIQKFSEEWNSGKISFDKDQQNYSHGISNPTLETAHGHQIPINNLSVNISLEHSLYFGYFNDLPTSKALENNSSNKIIYLLSSKDVLNIDKNNLIKIDSIEAAPVPTEVHIKILQLPQLSASSFKQKFQFEYLG